ncbi:MAG: acetolactate decarboxylase [Methanomassiliicoccales archaeon]
MAKAGSWAYAMGVAILVMSSGMVGYWLAPGEASAEVDRDTYYQVSTYGRLSEGGYRGMISIDRLLEHGDFGIGTVEGIDGEMMVIDGVAYRAGTDLSPVEVPSGTMVPFAMLTYFDHKLTTTLWEHLNYTTFKDMLDDVYEDNLAYAVMIEAEFDSITIRSVPGQQEPYPPLVDVVANQTTLRLEGVRGTMIGYHISEGLEDINVPGFHMHFLSEDLSYGGHVLDVEFSGVELRLDVVRTCAVLVTDGVIT